MRNNILLLCVSILVSGLFISAQERALTKEEMEDNLKLQEALIKLQEAKEERDTSMRDYNMNREFYEKGIVTLKELNEAQQKYESAKLKFQRAEIELQKTRLGFLNDAARIEIVTAKKYLTEDGDRKVSVTLKNASNVRKALASDSTLKKSDVMNLLCIKQMKVSLKSGSIISSPYAAGIDRLEVGEEATVDFHLLKDVQDVVVELAYGAVKETRSVFLRKESLREIPTIETSQGSQQGELGTVISYAIELERLAEDEKRFNLIKIGLPRYYTAQFKYNKATVSNIKFTDKISRINVSLEIAVPEKLDRELVGDPVEFFVAVTVPSEARTIGKLNAEAVSKGRSVTREDLDRIKCNYLQLDLTPIGKGKLEIEIENRFKEIIIGESADFRIFITNTGTLDVANVKVDITPPFEWSVTADPLFIDSLAPDTKKPVTITALPGSGAEIGEYDVRLSAAGEAGYEEVESEEKDFTVKLAPKAKLMQNLILVGVLIAVVVIISIVSIIVSRR